MTALDFVSWPCLVPHQIKVIVFVMITTMTPAVAHLIIECFDSTFVFIVDTDG